MAHEIRDYKIDTKLHESGVNAMHKINARIKQLLELAPSDAAAELLVRKCRAGYKGMLKIYSQQRKFTGVCTSRILSEVFDHVFEEVRCQIDEWKRHRFSDPVKMQVDEDVPF